MILILAGGCATNLPAQRAIAEPAVSSEPAQAQSDTPPVAGPVIPAAQASEKAPGIVVYIDPVTGEFLPGLTPGVIPPPDAAAVVKIPSTQFSEVPSSVPGGGNMIDLKGQFRTPLVATMDADGNVTVKHGSAVSTGAVEK
jgi:hypothetical protein